MSVPVNRVYGNDAHDGGYDREEPAIAKAGSEFTQQNRAVRQAADQKCFERMPFALAGERVGHDCENTRQSRYYQPKDDLVPEVSLRAGPEGNENPDKTDHDQWPQSAAARRALE